MLERTRLAIGCVFLLLHVGSFNAGGLGLKLWTKTRLKDGVVLKHFWRSTGLSPAGDSQLRKDFLLSQDEKFNLDFIGALPNQAIEVIRIHWLLDLVTLSNPDSEKPDFHLENLDRLIDRLYRNGLRPGFELMGNPSGFFKDFKTQSEHWVSLLEQITRHYTNLYGADYVQEWEFELMNEPDLKKYNTYNFTLNEYLEYVKASRRALPNLRGPAGLFRHKENHPLCWGLLDFCNSNPCNLTMITFHRKGDGVGSAVVGGSLDLINAIISKYSNLKKASFGNDEGDIMKGWQTPTEWRADVRYAASVVQVIIGHVEEMFVKRNINFGRLSNDNAFLSFSPNYFTQRTLLARFQMNNTAPVHVQFFRKPVYSVMGMLSLLGNDLKDVRHQPGEKGFSYLVTSDKYRDNFLGAIGNDNATTDMNDTWIDVSFKIELRNWTVSGVAVGHVMDNEDSSPYHVWREGGSPDFPGLELREKMREAEGFKRIFIREVKPHTTRLKFNVRNVSVPSVFSVNVCYKGTNKPGQPTELRYANVTHNEIVLFWSDAFVKTRCILTYIVEFRQSGDKEFQRINKMDSIFLVYHHVETEGSGVAGEYRVGAVDYWNRIGGFSPALTVPR